MATKPLGISGDGIETSSTSNPVASNTNVEGFMKRPQMAAGEIFKFLNEPHQNELTRDPVLLQTTVIEYHGEILFPNGVNGGAPVEKNNVLNVPVVPAAAATANAAILSSAVNPIGLGGHGPGMAAGSTIFSVNAAQHASFASLNSAASPLARASTTVVSINNNLNINTSTATSLGGGDMHTFQNTSAGGSAVLGATILTATPAPASILNHALFHGHGRLVSTLGYTYTGEFDRGLMHGKGRIVWSDGTSYEGTFAGGIIDGSGKYVWPNGDHYEGEVRNSVRHGKGKFYLRVSGEVYEGDWFGGMRHGQGTLFYSPQVSHSHSHSTTHTAIGSGSSISSAVGIPTLNPSALSTSALGQNHNNSNTTSASARPTAVCKYVGTWDRDKKAGMGTLTYSNGDTYEGEWYNDLRNGKGVMTWRAGPHGNVVEIYNGEWVDGVQEGYGESTYIRPTAAGALAFAQSVALAQSGDGATPMTSTTSVPKAPQMRRLSQAGAGVLPSGGARPSAMTLSSGVRKSTVLPSPSSSPAGSIGGMGSATGGGGDESALAALLTDPCGNLGSAIVLSSVAAASAARERALNSYAGEFVQGQREGFGVFIYDDGSTYEGMWVNNVKHGEGKLVSANGVTFVGTFENGVPTNREDSQHIKNLRAGLNASPPTSPRIFGQSPSASANPQPTNNASSITAVPTSISSEPPGTMSTTTSAAAARQPGGAQRGSATSLNNGPAAAPSNASSATAAPNTNGDANKGANTTVSTSPTPLLTVVANPVPLYIKDIVGVGENCVPEAIAAVQTVSSRYHSTLKKLFFYYSHLEKGGVEVVTVPNGTNPEVVASAAAEAAEAAAIVEFSAVNFGASTFKRASIGGGAGENSKGSAKGAAVLPTLPPPPPPPPISWKKGRTHGTMHVLQLLRLLNDSRLLNQSVTIAVVDRIIANLRDVHSTTDPTTFGSIGIQAPQQQSAASAPPTLTVTADGSSQPNTLDAVAGGSSRELKKNNSSSGFMASLNSTTNPTTTAGGGSKLPSISKRGASPAAQPATPVNQTPQRGGGPSKVTPSVTPLKAGSLGVPKGSTAASPNLSGVGTFPSAATATEKDNKSYSQSNLANENKGNGGVQFSSAASIRGGGDDDYVRVHSPAPTLLGGMTNAGNTTAGSNAIFRQAWVQYRAHLHTLAVGELNYREFVEVLVRLSVKVFPGDVYGSVARRFALLIEEYLAVFPVGGSSYAAVNAAAPMNLAAALGGGGGGGISISGTSEAFSNMGATPTVENLSLSQQPQQQHLVQQPYKPQPLFPTTAAESMRILLWSKLPPTATNTLSKTYAVPPAPVTTTTAPTTASNGVFDGSGSMGFGINPEAPTGDIPTLKSGSGAKGATNTAATAARRTSISQAGLKQQAANHTHNNRSTEALNRDTTLGQLPSAAQQTSSSTVTAIPPPSTAVAELAAKRYKGYTYLQVLQELFLYYSGRATFESSSEGIYGSGTVGGGAGPFLLTTTRKEQHLVQDRAAMSLGLSSGDNPMSNNPNVAGSGGGGGSAGSARLTANKLQQASNNASGVTSSAVTPRIGMLTARPSMVAFNIADLMGGGGGPMSESANPLVAGGKMNASSSSSPFSLRQLQNSHSYANRQLQPGHPLTLNPPIYAGRTITLRQFLLLVRDLGCAVIDASLINGGPKSPSSTADRGASIILSANNTPSATALPRGSFGGIAAAQVMSDAENEGPVAAADNNVYIGKTPKTSGVVPKKKKLNVLAEAQKQDVAHTSYAAAAVTSPMATSITSSVVSSKGGPATVATATLTPKQAMADFTSLIAYLCGGQYARFDRYPSTTATVLQKQQFAIAEQQRLETPAAKNNMSVNQFVKKKAAEGDAFMASGGGGIEENNSPTKSVNTTNSPTNPSGGGPASALILTTVSEASAHANAAAMFNAYQHLLKKSKGKQGIMNEVDTLLMERELVFAEFVDLVVSMGIACTTARMPTNMRAGPPMLATTKVENFFEKVLIPHHNNVW